MDILTELQNISELMETSVVEAQDKLKEVVKRLQKNEIVNRVNLLERLSGVPCKMCGHKSKLFPILLKNGYTSKPQTDYTPELIKTIANNLGVTNRSMLFTFATFLQGQENKQTTALSNNKE